MECFEDAEGLRALYLLHCDKQILKRLKQVCGLLNFERNSRAMSMPECFGFSPCSNHKDLVWFFVLGQGRVSKCEIIPPMCRLFSPQ